MRISAPLVKNQDPLQENLNTEKMTGYSYVLITPARYIDPLMNIGFAWQRTLVLKICLMGLIGLWGFHV
jgi:hypothetical protein